VQNIQAPQAEMHGAQAEQMLSPPKSLPELAKDMYGGEPGAPIAVMHKPAEPPSGKNMPHLDMSLIRNVPDVGPRVVAGPELKDPDMSAAQKPLGIPPIQGIQQPIHQSFQSIQQSPISSPVYINVGDSFFVDFERFLKSGRGSDMRFSAMDILDKMKSYHGQKDILAELKDLERLWMLVEQRKKAVAEMSYSIESEILNKSQEMLSKSGINRAESSNIPPPTISYPNILSSSISAPTTLSSVKVVPFSGLLREAAEKKDIIYAKNDTSEMKPDIQYDIRSYIIYNPSQYFYFHDGNIARSFTEFCQVLDRIDDSVFYHHVNSSRNDFANWVEGVFQQSELATNIRICRTKQLLIDYLDTVFRNR
jgi:hypothetical protein